VLAVLLGSYGAVVDPAIFIAAHDNKGPSPELVRLHSARLVSASELPEGGRLSESVVKRLTGGDAISARDLYQGIIEFQPTWKIAIATNHRPIVRDTSEGFWRRVHLVPFENVFSGDQRDNRLREKLLAELPGILNWAIIGCDRWQRDGLERPAEVAAATSTYRSESDLVGAFISDRCLEAQHAQAKGAALYAAFSAWAKQGGERAATSRAFLGELRTRGFSSRKSNSDYVFAGIGIRDEQHDTLGDIA
jgi:putative DNA primase/helicase